MPKALIVVLLCGTASLASLGLTASGAGLPSAVLPFDPIHAAVSSAAACALLAATRYPAKVALLAIGLAIVTLGVGLLDLALFAVGLLDSSVLGANALAGGLVFLVQGLLSLRGLRPRVLRDPPGGPGPLPPA